MTTLNIKICGIEGDSVLVKYSTENSLLSIDEYDAVAYQPLTMGYTSLDTFIEAIKPALLDQVTIRDRLESGPKKLDLSDWDGHESTHPIIELASPLQSQVIVSETEVVL